MLKRKIGLGLVFAFAMLVPASQVKAHCGHCHKEKVVSTCNPCKVKTVSCKPSFCERLCCKAPKPRCGCGSTYTRDHYYNTPTTYDTYESYSGRVSHAPTYSSMGYHYSPTRSVQTVSYRD